MIITADLQTLCTAPAEPCPSAHCSQTGLRSVGRLVELSQTSSSAHFTLPDPLLASSSTCCKLPHQPWRRHGQSRVIITIAAGSLLPSGPSHGRSLLQVSGLSVRVQALSPGGASVRSSVPPAGPEAGGAGPAGGRPALQRTQTRRLLPTHDLPLSVLPGVHDGESADLLPVPEPDQPELRCRDSGAGRGAQVG